MPDEALVSRLHGRHYSDMPRQEFDAKIGYTSAFNPVAGASVAPPLSGMGAGGADVPWYAQPDTPSVQVPPSPIDPGLRPLAVGAQGVARNVADVLDRKSTRLNSSH